MRDWHCAFDLLPIAYVLSRVAKDPYDLHTCGSLKLGISWRARRGRA